MGLGSRGAGRCELEALVEHGLAFERAMHRGRGGDRHQASTLILGQVLGQADDHLTSGRTSACGDHVINLDDNLTDLPPFAPGVRLHAQRGAGGQARGEQLLWGRRLHWCALVPFTGGEAKSPNLDLVVVAAV
jgi:hypothetical protein